MKLWYLHPSPSPRSISRVCCAPLISTAVQQRSFTLWLNYITLIYHMCGGMDGIHQYIISKTEDSHMETGSRFQSCIRLQCSRVCCGLCVAIRSGLPSILINNNQSLLLSCQQTTEHITITIHHCCGRYLLSHFAFQRRSQYAPTNVYNDHREDEIA